jgi:hypothetical protein
VKKSNRVQPGTTSTTAPVARRDRTILDEAKGLVHGDRNQAYGTPARDFGRGAGMLNGLYKTRLEMVRDGLLDPAQFFEAVDIPRIQICVKLSRSMHTKRRDNWVDAAGYSEAADWTEEDERT